MQYRIILHNFVNISLFREDYSNLLVLLCEGENKTMEKELKNNNLEESSHILIPVKYYMM